jgi:hypothetical protein
LVDMPTSEVGSALCAAEGVKVMVQMERRESAAVALMKWKLTGSLRRVGRCGKW